MPRIDLDDEKTAFYGGGGFGIQHSPSGASYRGYIMHFGAKEAEKLYQLLGEYLKESKTSTTALLMGGPRHGEILEVPGRPRNIKTPGAPPYCATFFEGNTTTAEHFQTHVYTKRNDYGLALDIYEHSSLADENVTLKAKRLDESLSKAQAARIAAEQKRNDATMRASAAIEDREKARQALSEALVEEAAAGMDRDSLAEEFGV